MNSSDAQTAKQRQHQWREQLFAPRGHANLKQTSVRGGAITMVAQALRFVLQTSSIMVLARLLSDDDYGVQAMVLAVTGVCQLFKDGGLSMATVQCEEISHDQTSMLFWINAAIGLALTLLLASLAPLLAWYNHEPRVFWAMVVSSAGFFCSGLGVQHQALLQRSMRFVTIAKIDIASLLVGLLLGVGMAAAGYRYWALVAQALLIPLVSTIGTWIAMPWVPSRPRHAAGLKSMLQFGGTTSLNNIIVFLAYNTADKLIIGRLGTVPLGLYNRAASLISLPTSQMQAALFNVAFAALSKLQADPVRLGKAFLRGLSVVVALTLPLMVVCAVFPTEVVTTLLGSKWKGCVPIFQLLVPALIVGSVLNPMGWLLYATGRTRRSLLMAFVLAPVVVIGMAVGKLWGSVGVAAGYSIAMVLLMIPLTTWAIHGTGISVREFWRALSAPGLAAAVAAGAALGVKHLCGEVLPSLALLVLGSAVVAGVFLALLLFVMGEKHFYADLLNQLLHRKPPADLGT